MSLFTRQGLRDLLVRKLVGVDSAELKRLIAAAAQAEEHANHHPLLNEARLLATARALAADPDFAIRQPYENGAQRPTAESLRIGLYGNVANNLYITARCLRRLGYQADVVIEDGFFDAFLMNRPFWEDLEVTCEGFEEGLTHESQWAQPNYVRRVAYDQELSARFNHMVNPVPELQALYADTFGKGLAADRALVLAKFMGHWPYLESMADYDVVLLSYAPIQLGAFCPKPYVVMPVGSDLYLAPFEEHLTGLMFRAGYRAAARVLAGTDRRTSYLYDYLPRLVPDHRVSYMPLLFDSESYAPAAANGLRDAWQAKAGGGYYVVSVCRQDWRWKGSDRLIRAVAQLDDPDLRLVLLDWGEDAERSKQLVAELGLDGKVLWEPFCSKPLVKQREQAADVVADQFVMTSYGSSVYESLAAAKPVLMRYDRPAEDDARSDLAPIVDARSVDEIATRLRELKDPERRAAIGAAGRDWLLRRRGYESQGARFVELLAGVAAS